MGAHMSPRISAFDWLRIWLASHILGRRLWQLLRGWAPAVVVVLFLIGLAASVYAADISGALYFIEARYTNDGTDIVRQDLPFGQGASVLIDSDFIRADALNTAVRFGSEDVAAQPSSAQLDMKSAFVSTTAIRVDMTTEVNDATTNDVILTTSTPALGEAFFFGFDTASRILHVTIGQPAVGTFTVAWEYFSTSTGGFRVLTNVVDNTSAFQATAGIRTVSWDMPLDFGTSTQNGTNAFWVRARTDSFTSQTQQALGTRVQFETGQWWVFFDSLLENAQRVATLFLGGQDMQSFHPIMVGPQGITTTDSASLEPAFGAAWELLIQGFIDTTRVGANIVDKEAAGDRPIRIFISAVNEITARIEDADLITAINLVLTGVEPGHLTSTLTHNTSTNDHTFTVGTFTTTSVLDIDDLVDNAAAWEWAQDGVMPFIDRIRFRMQDNVSTTAQSSNDQYVRDTTPDTNFGASTTMLVRNQSFSPDQTLRTLVRFAIPTSTLADSTIASADMRLHVSAFGSGADTPDLSVEFLTQPWAEATVTWNTQPNGGNVIDTILSDPKSTGFRTWDITTAVRDWIDDVTVNNGVRVTSTTAVNENTRTFDTKENADNNPNLIISFTASRPLDDTDTALFYQATTTPSPTIFDRSGTGNTGNRTWPDQASSTLVVAVGSLSSVNEPASVRNRAQGPNVAGTNTLAISNLDSEETGSFLPGFDLVDQSFAEAAVPTNFFYVMLSVILLVVVGTGVAAVGGVKMAMFTVAILMIGLSQMGDGLISAWMIAIYIAVALAALASDRVSATT